MHYLHQWLFHSKIASYGPAVCLFVAKKMCMLSKLGMFTANL